MEDGRIERFLALEIERSRGNRNQKIKSIGSQDWKNGVIRQLLLALARHPCRACEGYRLRALERHRVSGKTSL